MSIVLCRNESNTILLFKIVTMGLSSHQKAGTRRSHCVAKLTASASRKSNSTADGNSFTTDIAKSTIATQINKTRTPLHH